MAHFDGAGALPAGTVERERQVMMVCDSRGGTLALDLSCPELRWLVDAYRYLVGGAMPMGAGLLKVQTGEKVYWLSRRTSADRAGRVGEEIRIANLYDPAEEVRLSRDLADLVADMVERLCAWERPAPAREGRPTPPRPPDGRR